MPTRESAAIRVLLVSFDPDTIQMLTDVVLQMGIHLEHCPDVKTASRLLCNSKYEGFIADLMLGEEGLALLKSLPDFTSNKGAVSCAVLSEAHQKAAAFQAGANFLLDRPLDKDAVFRTIRAAYPMMVRERRRYFRCPIQTTTFVTCDGQTEFRATSMNISEAGMALLSPVVMKAGQNIKIRMCIPGRADFIEIGAEVCWADSSGRAGIQFVRVSTFVAEALQAWLLHRLEEMCPQMVGQGLSVTQVRV
jgi:DNA-binding response OmpR family regulator